MNARVQDKPLEWPTDSQSLYSREGVAHMDVGYMPHGDTRAPNPDSQDSLRGRKRQWEHEPQLHSEFQIHNLRSNFLYALLPLLANGYPCDVHVGPQGYDTYRTDQPYDSQEIPGLPPRKRMHHTMIPGFDVLNGAPLQSQNMSLQP